MDRVYNKLVRDKIPDIIKDNKEIPITRVLDNNEYKEELEKKLFEECNEVVMSSGSSRIEELADVLEVVKALAELEDKSLDDVNCACSKREKRGAFEKRIFLEKVKS